MTQHVALINLWLRRVGALKVAHYRSSVLFGTVNSILGGVLVTVSAAITAFGSMSLLIKSGSAADPGDISKLIPVITTVLGLIATIAAGWQNLLRYGERAEKHRTAGATYAKLEMKAEHLLACWLQHPAEFAKQDDEIDDFYDEWVRLTGGGPAIPNCLYEKYCLGNDRWNDKPRVDDFWASGGDGSSGPKA